MAITGPRGTGKTYGLLKYILNNNLRFIYMRRLRSQLEQCAGDESSNPFKTVNTDLNRCIVPQIKRGTMRFMDEEDEDNPVLVGYGAALSTVATIRGSDFSDVDCIVFDEYIPMTTEKPIKNEATAFFNFLETVNRNRELFGKPPIKCFMLGNANQLMNPYFLEWHFMKTALKMIRGNQMVWRNSDSTRIMVMLLNSPISEKKKETALYKNAGNDFLTMAIDNSFRTDETSISPRKLSDCRHIVSFGQIGIYQLKSDGKHYISETVSKSNYLEENEINISIFRARYGGLKTLYLYGYCVFENYDCEMIFRAYLNI